MELPDTVISRQKSEILVEYFHKVFCERCGMDLKVELDFVEVKESKYRKMLHFRSNRKWKMS